MTSFPHRFFASLICLLLVGCEKAAETTTYRVKGVVQMLRDERTVVIDHEEIPGYMEKMIMPFKVKDAAEIAGLKPGEEIEFDYRVQEFASWIENVESTGENGAVIEEAEVDEDKLIAVGESLPDYSFLDEFGNEMKLSDHRGKPVALTFVFTRCPVPEYCPRMMTHFKAIDDLLRADAEAPADYQLLTISFDAWEDTPELMKQYGEAYDYSPEHWSLLSSDNCCTINEIAANIGLLFGEVEGGSYRHNLRTVILDPDGKISKYFTDESWAPEDVVAAIKAAAK